MMAAGILECGRDLGKGPSQRVSREQSSRVWEVSGARCQVSGVRCQALGVQCQVPGVKRQLPHLTLDN